MRKNEERLVFCNRTKFVGSIYKRTRVQSPQNNANLKCAVSIALFIKFAFSIKHQVYNVVCGNKRIQIYALKKCYVLLVDYWEKIKIQTPKRYRKHCFSFLDDPQNLYVIIEHLKIERLSTNKMAVLWFRIDFQ